jgi:hypothetical protein
MFPLAAAECKPRLGPVVVTLYFASARADLPDETIVGSQSWGEDGERERLELSGEKRGERDGLGGRVGASGGVRRVELGTRSRCSGLPRLRQRYGRAAWARARHGRERSRRGPLDCQRWLAAQPAALFARSFYVSPRPCFAYLALHRLPAAQHTPWSRSLSPIQISRLCNSQLSFPPLAKAKTFLALPDFRRLRRCSSAKARDIP